jgi:membrane protease YdiL (CAAX protease family)
MPDKLWFAVVGLGDERDIEWQVGAGMLIGGAIILVSMAFPQLQFVWTARDVLAFTFVVISKPFKEEAVFGNFITTTALERMGIVPALAISGALFAIFHFAVYHANVFYMFLAFMFRILAGLALIKFRSFMPGLIGHMLINGVSWIT